MRTLFLSIYTLLTLSVQADTITVECDTAAEQDAMRYVPVNCPLKKERKNIFVSAYKFLEKVLSPPRDSTYIDVQNYNWCAEAQLTSRLELYNMKGPGYSIVASPEMRTRIGPFFGWRWAFLGYNFDLKSVFIKGEDTDIGGSVYSAAFGLDLFYRRVGGHYKIRELTVGGKDYSSTFNGCPFDGIHIGMTRINFYYIFNYKRYSHQAAFSQTNRQLRSAGSPVAGVSYSQNRASLDWDKFATMMNAANVDYTAPKISQTLKNDEYSVNGGYAYNWVFAKNWLAASELTAGIGYLRHHSDINTDKDHGNVFDKIESFYKKNISFNSNMRLALLYNNGPWFAGTQAIMFYYRYGNGEVLTQNLLGSLYFYVGCNF